MTTNFSSQSVEFTYNSQQRKFPALEELLDAIKYRDLIAQGIHAYLLSGLITWMFFHKRRQWQFIRPCGEGCSICPVGGVFACRQRKDVKKVVSLFQ